MRFLADLNEKPRRDPAQFSQPFAAPGRVPVAYPVTIHCGWMPIFFAMLACRAMSFLRNSVNSSGELPTGK